MRVDVVSADAFGPFREKELVLAPGMTVVHGPNEAGKSSWYAALHAGLTGFRRLRGRGTVDQRRFRERHKPWHDRAWSVGVTVTLDDGRRLRFSRNLNTGDTTVTDAVTGRRLDMQGLEYEGSIDGSRLFGLNRNSAQATVFAAQADVLRVLEDAGELQELLQRAAATTTVDTTVEQALSLIDEQRRTRVGAPHIGQRPLRAALQELEEARRAADEARDAYDALQQLLVGRRRAQGDLRRAEGELQELAAAARWVEVERLAERIRRARALQEQVAASAAPAAADVAAVRSATEVLAALRDRGPVPTPPEGTPADELREQIALLPAPPVGDTAPAVTVSAAYEQLRMREAEHAAHVRTAPAGDDAPETEVPAEELRALAGALEAPEPSADPHLAARAEALRRRRAEAEAEHAQALDEHARQVEAHRAAQSSYHDQLDRYEQELAAHEQRMSEYRSRLEEAGAQARRPAASAPPARTRQPALLAAGAVLLGLAAVLVVVGLPVPAGASGVLGLIALGVGLRGTPATPPVPATASPDLPAPPPPPVRPRPLELQDPGPAPAAPAPDPELSQAEVALALREQSRAAVAEAGRAARSRAQELGLPEDPEALRALAVRLESRGERERAAAAWCARETELRREREAALAALVALLQPRLQPAEAAESPGAMYERYVAECAARAEQAATAARRADLEEALRLREQAEARHAAALARHAAAGQRALNLCTQLTGPHGSLDPGTAAERLQAWVEEQDRLRTQDAEMQQLRARLEQVLDGASLEELDAQRAAAQQEAGPRPDIAPEELEARLQEVQRWRDEAAAAVHDLGGRAAALREQLPSVAEAVEREEQAARRLAQVQQLAALLDLAAGALGSAKDKVNANLAPVIAARIRSWLPKVTASRYTDLVVDPNTLMVRVREPGGDYREATVLSHGTMEQVYLLLRLALGDLLSTNDESAPVVLDDVTVQSDRQRTEALLDLLHEVSTERQVVLFSQEDEVLSWATRALVDPRDRLVTLATG